MAQAVVGSWPPATWVRGLPARGNFVNVRVYIGVPTLNNAATSKRPRWASSRGDAPILARFAVVARGVMKSYNIGMQTSTSREVDLERPRPPSAFCPLYHHAVELIGRRWSGVILRAMLSGVCRFSELAAAIPELSDRMLSERLKEFEAEGIVARTIFDATPVRVEYTLTPKGEALGDVMASISRWASEWLVQPPTQESFPTVADRSGVHD